MPTIITIAILILSLITIITFFYKNQIIEFLRTKKSIFKILRNIREFVLNNITRIDGNIYSAQDTEPRLDENSMLFSQLCTESQLESELFKKIAFEIKDTPRKHRKLWEFVYIIQALRERGMISEGKKGVGYGVGQEPLPALFAKHGVEVLATDYNIEEAKKAGWAYSKEHLSSKELLNSRRIAEQGVFNKLVNIREVDMNHIPDDLQEFDFTWSSCALEHLGSIENGLKFVENSLIALKPGGIAVHTTEYNLSSNKKTLESKKTVIFRKKDIQVLVERLTKSGHEIYVNYNPGSGKIDKHIDVPPYKDNNHLKLRYDEYVTTSIGFIIRKKIC